MPPTDEDHLREVVDEAECRRLLGTTATGRLGFTDSALPAIVPVAFTLHDGQVLVPARQGSPVVNAVRGSVVALEAGTYEPDARTGWSVTVVGPARIITDAGRVATLDQLGVSGRPPGQDRCYIAVQLALVRGWRTSGLPSSPAPTVADGGGDGPKPGRAGLVGT